MTKSCKNNYFEKIINANVSLLESQDEKKIVRMIFDQVFTALDFNSNNTVDGKGSLSNNFSVIFPIFVHLLATKHMAKQSRASGQLSGGHWVE